MLHKVQEFIHSHHLLNEGDHVLVALSGGADSVALLCLLHELGYPVTALHCNFHLRGEESDRDEQFVRQLCDRLHIPLEVHHFDTQAYAQEHHISIEMAARDLRYAWFHQQLTALHAEAVAVAHHRDDQAETLLLNLIRGTGIRGLCGMHPRQGDIVRPLLCISRADILSYLSQKGETYVTDSTNLQRDALRNRIRLDVLPLLKTLNPRANQNLAHTTEIMRQSLCIYQEGLSTHSSLQSDTLQACEILSHPSSETLLHEWLQDCHFTAIQEAEMLTALSTNTCGQQWISSTHRVLHDRDTLCRQEVREVPTQGQLHVQPVDSISDKSATVAYVDADKVQVPLTVRRVRQGDRFVPFGMQGSRLVSDFLTDRKLSRFQKENQLVVLSGDDIVWVVNQRSDNRYRIDEHTHHILKLSFS